MKKSYFLALKSSDFQKFSFFSDDVDFISEFDYRFFDTFDNKIRNNDYYLYFFTDNLILGQFKNEKVISSLVCDYKSKYTFNDFDNTIFKEFLSPLIQNRAILQIFECKVMKFQQNVENEKGDLVFKKHITKVHNSKDKTLIFVELEYEKKSKLLKIEKDNLNKLNFSYTDKNLFCELYNFFDFQNKGYTPKINLKNAENQIFYTFAKNILKQLTNKIILNVDGIINDFDIEFLHDLRVSARKITSFLKETKIYFTTDVLEFTDVFTQILKNTNKLRDTDIFLETNKNVYDFLDENEKKHFDKIIESVSLQRAEIQILVANFFKSQFFVDYIEKWKIFIENSENYKQIETNIVAKEIVFSNLQKFFLFSKDLNPKLSDKQFHRVRIRTKKLRYNIDLFCSFFNIKKAEKALVNLKKFQDYMGVISDLSFFEVFIKSFEKDNEVITNQLLYKIENKKNEHKNKIIVEYSKALKSAITVYF